MIAPKWFAGGSIDGRRTGAVAARVGLVDRLRRYLVVAATGLGVVGCTVEQDVRRPGCEQERCSDAAAGEGGQDTVVLGDAKAPPSTSDAGLVVCPGPCMPDDVAACVGYEPLSAASDSGIAEVNAPASTLRWLLAVGDAGYGDAGYGDASFGGVADAAGVGEGGVGESVSEGGAPWDSSGDGGLGADAGRDAGRSILQPAPGSDAGLPPPAADLVYACQMAPSGDRLMSECARAGRGEEGAPCTSPAGCAPGLACVAPGFCRAYCCAGQDSCAERKVCEQRPLHYGTQANSGASLEVPVCVPVESSCSLGQPWVCESERCGNCPPDKTCSVLDKRGSRACVDFGSGLAGDECPCAPGYFCASGSRTCFQYCETTPGGVACDAGYSCQPGPAAFPSGWGLCVQDAAP